MGGHRDAARSARARKHLYAPVNRMFLGTYASSVTCKLANMIQRQRKRRTAYPLPIGDGFRCFRGRIRAYSMTPAKFKASKAYGASQRPQLTAIVGSSTLPVQMTSAIANFFILFFKFFASHELDVFTAESGISHQPRRCRPH